MLLVDAANVIGSRPDGWWRDRAGATRQFVDRVRTATREGRIGPPVVIVLEGDGRRGVGEGTLDGVRVVHAPGEGDDTIATIADRTDVAVTVVTADRGLRARLRSAPTRVVGPRWLLDRLDAPPG
jgi:hypothetical protein